MNKSWQFLIGLVMAVAAGVAGATQWASYGTVSTAGDEYTITVGTQSILVRAYSTTTASSTLSVAQGGNFSTAATVGLFPGTEGFGINNMQGVDPGEGSFPEWSVDNMGLYDVLVFEMPNKDFAIDALQLGFADGDSDISVFWGGNNLGSGYNFSQACFSSCSNNGATNGTAAGALTASNLGFEQININDAAVGTPVDLAFTNPGRYLVVAGSLTDTTPDDKFKVNMIQGHKAPVPGTLALLGLALVGMGALKRRNAA